MDQNCTKSAGNGAAPTATEGIDASGMLIEIPRLPPHKLRKVCRRIGLSDLDIVEHCIGEYNGMVREAHGRNPGNDEQAFTNEEAWCMSHLSNCVSAIRNLTRDGEAYDLCVKFLKHEARVFYNEMGRPKDSEYERLTTHPPRPKKDRSWSSRFRRRYERMRTARVVFVDAV